MILFWPIKSWSVIMLAAASMTALQDAQAPNGAMWRLAKSPRSSSTATSVARSPAPSTITFGVAVLIMLLVRGQTTVAAPFYGVGVFLPIMVMGLAVRQHFLQNYTGAREPGAALGAAWQRLRPGRVRGPDRGKWEEGGWIRLITFTTLFATAHLVLLFACRTSHTGTNSPHRPRQGACARRDGFHRRVAVGQDAAIPL